MPTPEKLSDQSWFYILSGWLYFCILVFLVVVVFLRKREPASVLAWSLSIIFVPVIGPLFFLLFGLDNIPRRLLRKVAHRQEFSDRFPVPGFLRVQEESFKSTYQGGRWGSMGQLIEGLGEAPRRLGNSTHLYSDGKQAFEDMEQAIEAARHHIHIEFYIFRADSLGRQFIDQLIKKCKEGVQVRLIIDAIGTPRWWNLLHKVRKAGGEASSFLHLSSIHRVSPNLRNHRKIVICDGDTAFFGGLNVGKEYLGRTGRRGREWFDLHMRIHGPAVWDLQLIFIEDWDYCTRQTLSDPAYFPEIPVPPGNSPVQIIAGGPDVEVNPIRQVFFSSINHAEKYIYIATPYIVPDLAIRESLKTAARSGVEINLITQSSPPDHYLTYYCSQFYMEELLAAGVRIYEFTSGMMHAKAISVDGEWAMLGTANLDNRSMFLNFEQMATFDGEAEVEEIETSLKNLISNCREIHLQDMRGRHAIKRVMSAGAHLFAPLL